ncbi:MAG: 50S ribosomal protein L30e [Thermoprotei archaeon]
MVLNSKEDDANMVDIARELKVAMQTGKIEVGYNSVRNLILTKNVSGIIIAGKGPSEKIESLKYYSKISKIPVYVYDGTSWDLGRLCGKPFMVSVVAIINPGESEIMKIFESSSEEDTMNARNKTQQ